MSFSFVSNCDKVHIFVQPPLGIPGDPMRLLFERDMTPHPQYAAFYKWMEAPNELRNNEASTERDAGLSSLGSGGGGVGLGADAVLHFGMHGTVEWLPGTSLGNTGDCWPDILTGGLPNV